MDREPHHLSGLMVSRILHRRIVDLEEDARVGEHRPRVTYEEKKKQTGGDKNRKRHFALVERAPRGLTYPAPA